MSLEDLRRYPTISWRNNSSEDCPPFGLFEITGAESDDGSAVAIGDKPTSTPGLLYGINAGLTVAAGGYGDGMTSGLVIAKYGTGSLTLGLQLGPDGWNLSAGKLPIFTVSGSVNTDDKLVQGLIEQPRWFFGKADASISKGSSGTVSIWSGPAGSEADTGFNVTAYALGAAITSGKWVTVKMNNGIWYVGPWEC